MIHISYSRLVLFLVSLQVVSCSSMIENGRDHRHDPQFTDRDDDGKE